jgi:glycosyltransferase involved in cell wall biosynthesis
LLAEEFSKAGHQTVVVTQSRGEKNESDPLSGIRKTSELYRVSRCPEAQTLLRLYHWCDVVLQNQIGLQSAWPLVFVRRPWIIAHHNWLDIQKGARAWVKLRLLRFARNIAASQALADRLTVPVKVIPNPYRKELFKLPRPGPRPKDLIFAGRLIRGKGVHILIEALRECARRGTRRELTVVGDGQALAELRDRANGLAVEFVASKRGNALSEVLTNHRILVVPSIEPEPFGLIAIEGLACGCAVIASSHPGSDRGTGQIWRLL